MREIYPPSQLAADSSTVYDYIYEYVGPKNVVEKIIGDIMQTLEEVQKLKDLTELVKDDR